MKQFNYFRSVTMGVIAAALVVCSGCAGPNAKVTVDSMTSFGTETAKAKDSVDSATSALETLTGSQASDIKTNLDAYSKAVTALEDQATVVRTDAEKMQVNGDSFFTTWEGSESITPERRAELSASYAQIKNEMAAAKDGFTPFLASLKDIQSYLSLDTSVKGINSVSGMVAKAKNDGANVKAQLDAVLTQVNKVRGMLSTKSE